MHRIQDHHQNEKKIEFLDQSSQMDDIWKIGSHDRIKLCEGRFSLPTL